MILLWFLVVSCFGNGYDFVFCFCCRLFLFVVCTCILCLLPCHTRCSFIDVLSCTPTGVSEINHLTCLSTRKKPRELTRGTCIELTLVLTVEALDIIVYTPPSTHRPSPGILDLASTVPKTLNRLILTNVSIHFLKRVYAATVLSNNEYTEPTETDKCFDKK